MATTDKSGMHPLQRIAITCMETQVSAHLVGGTGAVVLYVKGPPGSGKTQILSQIATFVDEVTFDPFIAAKRGQQEFIGMSIPDLDKNQVRMLLNDRLFNKHIPEGKICLQLWDEWGLTPLDVQGVGKSVIEEWGSENAKLSPYHCIALASNRPGDGCGAQRSDRAVEDRCTVVEHEFYPKGYLMHAAGKTSQLESRPFLFNDHVSEWEHTVLAFNTWLPELINPTWIDGGDSIQPSGRSYEKLSRARQQGIYTGRCEYSEDGKSDDLEKITKGLLGETVGGQYLGFLDLHGKLVPFEDMVCDPAGCRTPDDSGFHPEAWYAMAGMVSSRLSQKIKDGVHLDSEVSDAVVTYFERASDEMQVASITMISNASDDFTKSRAYRDFAIENQDML